MILSIILAFFTAIIISIFIIIIIMLISTLRNRLCSNAEVPPVFPCRSDKVKHGNSC